MSYCVNCGVELSASEKRCPLCGVEVINPVAPYDPAAEKPFPADVETVEHRTVRRTAAAVLSLLIVIPFVSVIAADLIDGGRFGWSVIPAAAILLGFMTIVFPCLFKRPKVWLFMLFGVIEVAAFLFGLSMWLKGHWYFTFALPMTALIGAYLIGCWLMISSKKARLPLKVIIVLVMTMVLVLVMQLLIELHIRGRIRFDWSIYTAISCGIMSIAVLIVGKLFRKREDFRKKMFF